MPLLIQPIRGAKTSSDKLPEPYPTVILDLKGDPALFHTVKKETEARGQKFDVHTGTSKSVLLPRDNFEFVHCV
jgi:hypothetical protein